MPGSQTVDISPRAGADKVLWLHLASLGLSGAAHLHLLSPSRGAGAGHDVVCSGCGEVC